MVEEAEVKKNMKICLLGASLDTGNLGVGALAESSIKIILHRWPDAQITLLGSGYRPGQQCLTILDKEACVKTLPLRFSKNIFLPYHFLWYALYGLLARVLPKSGLRNAIVNRNPYCRMLFETDLALDISGGDSFSDIYGIRRFLLLTLAKWLMLLFDKELVMLPQTYGPFKRRTTKMMASYILKRASLVYSRDRAGLEYVNDMLNSHASDGKVRFAPDVGFVLDVRKPRNVDASLLSKLSDPNTTIVGFNISGLLYSGGYTQDNMFGLTVDYRQLVHEIIDLLLQQEKVNIILIPHVFSRARFEVENDFGACLKVHESTSEKHKDRVLLPQGEYSQSEIKYLIGFCDFFIGSRMHSCIAALSQCIPAVGIAYSKKFQGVFESIGLKNCVLDARSETGEHILERISSIFKERQNVRTHLEHSIPKIKEDILKMLDVLQAADVPT